MDRILQQKNKIKSLKYILYVVGSRGVLSFLEGVPRALHSLFCRGWFLILSFSICSSSVFCWSFHLVLPLSSLSSAGLDQEGFPQQINWHGWSAEMKLIRCLCMSDDLKNNWSRWVKDQWEIILLTQDLLPLPSSLPVDPEFSSDLQVV